MSSSTTTVHDHEQSLIDDVKKETMHVYGNVFRHNNQLSSQGIKFMFDPQKKDKPTNVNCSPRAVSYTHLTLPTIYSV